MIPVIWQICFDMYNTLIVIGAHVSILSEHKKWDEHGKFGIKFGAFLSHLRCKVKK